MILIFEALSGRFLKVLEGFNLLDEKRRNVQGISFVGDGSALCAIAWDGHVLCWSLSSGDQITEMEVDGTAGVFALSPDGETLVTTDAYGMVTIQSIRNRTSNRITFNPMGLKTNIKPHKSVPRELLHQPVQSLCLSPGGDVVAIVGYDGVIYLWNKGSGKLSYVPGGLMAKEVLSVSSDGQLLAARNEYGQVAIWSVVSSRNMAILHDNKEQIVAATFSSDGKYLLTANKDNTLKMVDVQSGVTVHVYHGHQSELTSIKAFGSSVYTTSSDGTVRLWSTESPKQWSRWWRTDGKAVSIALSSNGRTLVVGMDDGSLNVYGWLDGVLRYKISKAHDSAISRIVFSRDGQWLISAGIDSKYKFTSKEQVEKNPKSNFDFSDQYSHLFKFSENNFYLINKPSVVDPVKLWKVVDADLSLQYYKNIISGNSYGINSVAFDYSGNYIATAGLDGRVGLFDIRGDVLKYYSAHAGAVANVEFSVSGDKLLSVGADDFYLRIWNWLSNLELQIDVSIKQDKLLWSSVRSDGRELVMVGGGANATIVSLSEAKEQVQLVGHENPIYRAIYSPDGAQLATVSGDMTIRIWDMHTKNLLFVQQLPTEMRYPSPLWDFDFRCFQDGGCLIAVPLTMGRVVVYRLPYENPPAEIMEEAWQPGGKRNM